MIKKFLFAIIIISTMHTGIWAKSAMMNKIENYINNLIYYDQNFIEIIENKVYRKGHITIDKDKGHMKISYENGNYIEINGPTGYFYDDQIKNKNKIKIQNLPFAFILMKKKLNLDKGKIQMKDFEITQNNTNIKITAYDLVINLSFQNDPFKIIGWNIIYPK